MQCGVMIGQVRQELLVCREAQRLAEAEIAKISGVVARQREHGAAGRVVGDLKTQLRDSQALLAQLKRRERSLTEQLSARKAQPEKFKF